MSHVTVSLTSRLSLNSAFNTFSRGKEMMLFRFCTYRTKIERERKSVNFQTHTQDQLKLNRGQRNKRAHEFKIWLTQSVSVHICFHQGKALYLFYV